MTVVSARVGHFFHDGNRLEYTEYGGGDSWVVLLHAQMFTRAMHEPLARTLAGEGHHVITLDLLGHGRSDRPEDPMLYSMTSFGEQVLTLLDELGIERTVLGGTSLGANVSLEVAVAAPERLRGLLIEMPVLDNALEAGIIAFAPLLFAARFLPLTVTGTRVAGGLVSRLVPRRVAPYWVSVGLDVLDQRPGPMAAAIHGIFFGRVAPPSRLRRQIQLPALVVGHPHDPIHPAADAAMLAEELVDAEFVAARGIMEWRVRPARLDRMAADFVERCRIEPAAGRTVRG